MEPRQPTSYRSNTGRGAIVAFLLLAGCPPKPIDDTDDTDAAGCPEGFSGVDCSFCTWETAGATCNPGQSSDLFDLAAIKALTLEDLGWKELEDPLADRVTRVVGEINTPFAAVDVDGVDQDVMLRSGVAIYFPADWPARNTGKAFVNANHYADNVAVDWQVPSRIAEATGMVVVYHGEFPENWRQLGFDGRDDINGASASAMATRNPCEVTDLVRGQYSRVLAEIDMRVITLAQRLAGDAALDEFALRGFSKEGAAGWLALATDDRIAVSSVGGFPLEDRRAYAQNMIDVHGCAGDPEVDETAHGAVESLAWMHTTPAGAAVLNRYDASLNVSHLGQRIILLEGDVYNAEMHDGHYYTAGAEDTFLDSFDEVPWRYIRKTDVNPGSGEEGGDVTSTTVTPYLVAELLYRGDDPAGWYPKVELDRVTLTDGVLSAYAEVSGSPEQVYLWGSYSDDRIWNDPDQAAWIPYELHKSGGNWVGDVDLESLGVSDKVIGYYIEARNTMSTAGGDFARKDASPMRFLQEPPALTCDEVVPTDYCAE